MIHHPLIMSSLRAAFATPVRAAATTSILTLVALKAMPKKEDPEEKKLRLFKEYLDKHAGKKI